MDVEKLRKINMLSSELKKHGMAESSQDAYTQAQEIIQVIPKDNARATQESVIVETAPAHDPLAAKQFQIELEKLQKVFSDELDILRNAMNQLITEVNALREDLNKIQSAQPKQKEKQVELKTEPKVAHPRQGDWKPGDVDIQKMFYYGTKK
ncbi:MAG: hypothetical protein QXR48_02875 [Candidatus Woesearchaeota archaeon]